MAGRIISDLLIFTLLLFLFIVHCTFIKSYRYISIYWGCRWIAGMKTFRCKQWHNQVIRIVLTHVIVVVHYDCFKRGYVEIGSVWRQANLDISRQPKYQSASHILPASDCLLRKPGGWRWSGGIIFWLRTSSIWHAPRISIIVKKHGCIST